MLKLDIIPKHTIEPEKNAESLSFYVQYAQKLENDISVPLEIPRAISKSGQSYKYNVESRFGGLSIFEAKKLEEIKSSVIERIVSAPNPQMDMRAAEGMAYYELSKFKGESDARYFSKILSHDITGYGPISILMEDKANIQEIEVNGPTSPISIVHSKYGRCLTNMRFTHLEGFRRTINKFIYDSNCELNEDTPIIDVQVDDARLHAQISPYATSGANATIRVGGRRRANVSSLIIDGTADPNTLAYIWLAVESGANIIISGPPASGKTTLLVSILSFVRRHRRIVTIEEDINELKFYPNVANIVQLSGFKSKLFCNTRDQAINALRMRPDVLVVGEVRGNEARELFSGANLGVQFMTTLHSNENGLAVINRLLAKPLEVDPRVLSMLDLSIHMEKRNESGKHISQIIEYNWLSRAEVQGGGTTLENGDSVEMRYMAKDSLFYQDKLGESKIINMYCKTNSKQTQDAIKELQKRGTFLKSLSKKKIGVMEMADAIYNY